MVLKPWQDMFQIDIETKEIEAQLVKSESFLNFVSGSVSFSQMVDNGNVFCLHFLHMRMTSKHIV